MPSQNMDEEDIRDGGNSGVSPRKVPCTGGPDMGPSTTDSVTDQLLHRSDVDGSNNDRMHVPSSLDVVLTTLTSKIEEEVLAVCSEAGKGGEIVPSIFNKFRPADWNSTETIDLLDE